MENAWKQWEGQVVEGRFKLRQYLGGSQRGVVFLTEYAGEPSGKAAIKLVLVDPGNVELQLYRWKQAAKLRHPCLMRLLETGRCRVDNMTLLYAVMEYAEEDLSQILPHRALTSDEARAMLAPALNALAYIHAQRFVHGGLKPANILAVNDQVKLSSDSICEVNETIAGIRGATAYDAPERASGRTSPAADIWSLGVTLTEALTQQLPTWDERREPVFPEALPKDFVFIARQCLQSDPLKRPTVASIQESLNGKVVRAAVADIRAVPVDPRQEIRPPSIARKQSLAKRRAIFPVIAAIVGLVVLLGAWGILRHRTQPPQSTVGQTEAPPAASAQLPEKPDTAPGEQNTRKNEQNSNAMPAVQPSTPAEHARGETAGSVPGAVLHEPLPDVSRSARSSIHGTLRMSVKVHVDAAGRVSNAEFDSAGSSRYFADLALMTAREWTFQPAKIGGENVPSEWILRFEFTNRDTRVIPMETAP